MESPRPLGLVRESYLKTKVEAWISRYVELYYITTYLNEALKTYGPLIAPWLIDIARACFIIGYYPRLGRAITTFILRKEGKADYFLPGSYRPIALENTLSKILERVIADRIVDTAKEHALLL